MSKSVKLPNNVYIDSSGIIHSMDKKQTLKNYLPYNHSITAGYDNSSYIQLGYISCQLKINSNWSNLTLLISNSFYGVQHWSTYLLTIAQAQNVKANILKLGGNDRNFYYYINTTNKRIYLYAKCTGGNGYGCWNTVVLNDMECIWVQEIVNNATYNSNWVEILSV